MRWQPVEVLQTLPTVIPSSTRPSRVVTDVGPGYLKMPTTAEGPSALVSELIGTQLAEWLGLPVFDYAVVRVAEADVNPDSNDTQSVPAFVTREEPGNPWQGSVKELRLVENTADFSRIVVFDTWVGNIDRYSSPVLRGERKVHRNDLNVFMSDDAPAGRFTLKAYDHTHCQFNRIAASPQIDLERKIRDSDVYGCFPEFRKFLDREVVRLAMSRLSEMNEETARMVVESVPNEWITDRSARDRLITYILHRSVFVAKNVESKLFPQGELFHD
jgi:HipA-like kinase